MSIRHSAVAFIQYLKEEGHNMRIKRAIALFRVLVAIAIFVLIIALRIAMSKYNDSLIAVSICFFISFILLGASAAVKMIFFRCPHCKAELSDPHALSCPNCGSKVDKDDIGV